MNHYQYHQMLLHLLKHNIVKLSKFEDGVTVICEDPEPETWPLVTSIVSTVELSDVFFIVMFPVSASTFSLKLRTIVELSATLVALSAGTDELSVALHLQL